MSRRRWLYPAPVNVSRPHSPTTVTCIIGDGWHDDGTGGCGIMMRSAPVVCAGSMMAAFKPVAVAPLPPEWIPHRVPPSKNLFHTPRSAACARIFRGVHLVWLRGLHPAVSVAAVACHVRHHASFQDPDLHPARVVFRWIAGDGCQGGDRGGDRWGEIMAM